MTKGGKAESGKWKAETGAKGAQICAEGRLPADSADLRRWGEALIKPDL